MIRLLWWLALVAIAIVTVSAELDRASLKRPELAFAVPRPFRSFAQQPLAFVAMITAPPAEARAEAMRLVRRRPVPAEHLFVLALADQRAGDLGGFRQAFRAATARGWRVAPLQAAAAREALAGGDLAAAANRIAALWAMNPGDPLLPELTRGVLADDRGTAAFAAQLARTHVWQDAFLATGPATAGPAGAVRAVAKARNLGARFECAQLSEFTRRVATADPAVDTRELACAR